MTNLQMWSLIVGALTPPLLAVIQQPRWSGLVRSSFMVGAAAVDGVITTLLENNFDWSNWVKSSLMCGVAVIAAYHGIWKPNGVAPAIEKATVPGPVGT